MRCRLLIHVAVVGLLVGLRKQDNGIDDNSALESKAAEQSQFPNQPWEVKKQSILKEYTISGSVSVGAVSVPASRRGFGT